MKTLAASLLLILFSVKLLNAQTPIKPNNYITAISADITLDTLDSLYFSNKWDSLQSYLKEHLNNTIVIDTIDGHIVNPQLNFEKHHYVVTYKSSGKNLVSFHLNTPNPSPFTFILPGIDGDQNKLFQIFIKNKEDMDDSLSAVYRFSKKSSEISTQMAGFLNKITPAMVDIFFTRLAHEQFTHMPDSSEIKSYIEISEIIIPFKRAEIEVEHEVREAKSKFKIVNAPKTRFTLGVLAGGILKFNDATDFHLSNGNITRKLINRQVTMAIVNLYPFSFQAELDNRKLYERCKFFGGVTLTPEFGIGGGIGFDFMRGVSINIGYSGLLVDTIRDGDIEGNPPNDKLNPFNRDWRRSLFIAFSYDFKN